MFGVKRLCIVKERLRVVQVLDFALWSNRENHVTAPRQSAHLRVLKELFVIACLLVDVMEPNQRELVDDPYVVVLLWPKELFFAETRV